VARTVEKTGWAPLPVRKEPLRPAVSLVEPGETVPDQALVDQDGKPLRLSSLRGSAVLLTFVYTRCRCPSSAEDGRVLRDGSARRQGRTAAGPVRLLSVSFDPDFDTPAELRAMPCVSAPTDGLDVRHRATRGGGGVGARLGLSLIRDEKNPADITHNLRTAVIDRQGARQDLDGNQWAPAEAIAALASVPADSK